ncbi:MAG: hypothetical protein AMJ56_21035 [Anaerolineae bacterium SG8_19]|nr:MAG: hypothetical protein AMJ56_21035 [Anaerolineae bacterium SG8_19]
MLQSELTIETPAPGITQFDGLSRIARQLAAGFNLDNTLKSIFVEAMAFSRADGGNISLYSESKDTFVPNHSVGGIPPKTIIAPIIREAIDNQAPVIHKRLDLGRQLGSIILVTPIINDGFVSGLITLYSRKPYQFGEPGTKYVAALADLASAAIVNAQLYRDTLQRERFYASLGRVTLAINATVNLPTLLTLVCKESLELFDVDGAFIWQKEDDKLIGIAAEGHARDDFIGTRVRCSDDKNLAARAANKGYGVYSNNIEQDQRFIRHFPWQARVKASLAIPLGKDEELLGVLQLVDTSRNGRFGFSDVEQATYFGAQVAIAIQNAQLLTDMSELNEQLDLRVAERTHALGEERDRVQYLLRVTSELAASLDQDRVLVRALELVNEIVNATHGSILLVDTMTGELIYPAAFETHKLPPLPRVDLGIKPEEGLAGWIIKYRSAIIIDDTSNDDRWIAQPENSELKSVMAVPLIANDEVIGVLTLFHRESHAFTQEQLELVEAAASQVANAISNSHLYILIRDQAERLGNMLREEHLEAAKNQAILESIADGVLVTDATGTVILANLSAGQILEIPHDQLNGKPVNELLGLYAATGENWIHTVEEWAHSTRREGQPQFLAERLTMEDKFVSVRLSPVFASGQFIGTVSIFRDVTQAVEVDRMKSEFVSTVSHELRTPMTSIKGYAELMIMGDLLDISRIESGKTSLELQPVNLSQIVAQVVGEHLQGLISHEDKPIQVLTEISPTLPMVNADPDRVTQILTNLLDNAFQYTPTNGKISVTTRANGSFVTISVSDTGVGISQENQAKVFDRFFRVENSEIQQVPGTGLGLAIVRSLVEMHGGTIDVESTLGQGSTFTFTLPCVSEN